MKPNYSLIWVVFPKIWKYELFVETFDIVYNIWMLILKIWQWYKIIHGQYFLKLFTYKYADIQLEDRT